MGETMEPSEDPMILPTMESHRNLSESLFNIMDKYRRTEMKLMIGKEYANHGEWSIGGARLSEIWGRTN